MLMGSFLFFLLMFVCIGLLSGLYSKKTKEDYLTTGKTTPAWLVALSAVATNNSGYMFIGIIGYTYTKGISAFWLLFGFFFGDYLSSLFIHKKLRISSGQNDVHSFGELLSRWQGTDYKKLKLLTGLMTIIFLSIYAAAQLKAGSKALHVLFEWDFSIGALIGGLIVLLYCLAGGMRASIWTDAAQSFVMIFAMGLLFFTAINSLGGLEASWEALQKLGPEYLSLNPLKAQEKSLSAVALFVIGWIFTGFGVIGQPHIMMRFVTLNNPNDMDKTRRYYYSWYALFSILTLSVGICARLLIPETSSFDPELALPLMSMNLLPEVLVGLVLAGLFAATMSTADSQILSCSAALVKDIFPKKGQGLFMTKLATVIVTFFSLSIALYGNSNVFNLVVVAWSVLAAAFAPLMILLALGFFISETMSLIMVMTGVLTALTWRGFGFSSILPEVGPGLASGLLVYFLFRKFKGLKKHPPFQDGNMIP
jgi:SSS family transporter